MSLSSAPEHVVIDASAMVDLLARTEDRHRAVRARLAHTVMHAPAHLDAEVLSALGRMHRSGVLTVADVNTACRARRKSNDDTHLALNLRCGGHREIHW